MIILMFNYASVVWTSGVLEWAKMHYYISNIYNVTARGLDEMSEGGQKVQT